MEVSKVDIFGSAAREYGLDTPLPWDNVSTGVSKEYLKKEYLKAFAGEFTSDCRKTCHACGLKKCPTEKKTEDRSQETGVSRGGVTPPSQEQKDKRQRDTGQEPFVRVRLQYAKTGKARFLSHLELVRAMTRAMRRAGLPLRYSAGFHPAPRLSFGPALGVGIAGLREYLDLELLLPFEPENGLADLGLALPEGIKANMIQVLHGKEKSLNSFIIGYVYDIRNGNSSSVGKFLERDEVISTRKNEGINIKTMVEAIEWIDEETCRITVRDRDDLKVRLDELLPEIFGVPGEDLDVTRVCMYGWQEKWVEPMEGECAWAAKS
jgi:radical SAM-linked protein